MRGARILQSDRDGRPETGDLNQIAPVTVVPTRSSVVGLRSARIRNEAGEPFSTAWILLISPTKMVWLAEEVMVVSERKRLYLRVGDEVSHLRYEQWGIGVVMEVMTSSVPGGTCLVRVRFQDGQLRCFNNDLDNEACCYYFGVRRYWNPTHGVNAVRSKFFLPG
jgi:hypothetical protein